jgi:hypothetical protein
MDLQEVKNKLRESRSKAPGAASVGRGACKRWDTVSRDDSKFECFPDSRFRVGNETISVGKAFDEADNKP